MHTFVKIDDRVRVRDLAEALAEADLRLNSRDGILYIEPCFERSSSLRDVLRDIGATRLADDL